MQNLESKKDLYNSPTNVDLFGNGRDAYEIVEEFLVKTSEKFENAMSQFIAENIENIKRTTPELIMGNYFSLFLEFNKLDMDPDDYNNFKSSTMFIFIVYPYYRKSFYKNMELY